MEDLNEESVASFTKIGKVTSLLKRESRFFVGIERSDIQILTDALEQLGDFLKDADEVSAEEVMKDSVKSWLDETNDQPHVKGYFGADCLLKLSQLLQERRIVDFLTQAGQTFGQLKSMPDIEDETSEALSGEKNPAPTLIDLSRRSEFVERQSRKLFYSFLEDYLDSESKVVTERLLKGASTRSVISLVGPSGIGKTVLSRKVYESEIVRDRFDICGWIDVSGSYNVRNILKAMMIETAGVQEHDAIELEGMRMMELLARLRQSLQPKRYLFVFDDVFQDDFWSVIKQSLPENAKGSKIIITTSSEKVGDSCTLGSLDYVHQMKPFSDEMSRDLFYCIVFQDEPRWYHLVDWERFSSDVFGMCKGFPLPILGIAGLLSTKDKKSEWIKLHRQFRLDFKFNLRPPSALEVLRLGYLDLPNHLKACFLYFSIFPENSWIPFDKLYNLWIAEGFVEEKRSTPSEEVAEEYLNELVRRNMVQACKGFGGLEKFCRVHSLIHHMARVTAYEVNFCLIQDENNPDFRKNSLRLSINNVSNSSGMLEKSPVRSVFLFDICALDGSFVVNLKEKCELLTLLDLENVPIEDLPEELGNLFHLKYLSLRNTKVKKLPVSLGKLQNLQTLDLRNTLMTELPLEIDDLRNLQHLLAGVSPEGVKMRAGIGWLEKLHTLTTVDVSHRGIFLVKELAKLRKLRKLGISGLTADVGAALCAVLDEFIHLETLILQAKSGEMLKLQTISTMLTHMKCLVLKGQLPKFPYLIVGLPNLTTLCLSHSKLIDIPLSDLSDLPNLASLWLYRAFEGEELHFKSSGFRNLKLLVLKGLKRLMAVEIEEGALPRLEELRIGSSPHLFEVPSGIKHLKSLKALANYDMPSDFVLSIQPYCLDYWKVERIESVTFWYRVEGRNYKMYKLGDSELLDHVLGLSTDADISVKHPDELELSFCDNDDEEGNNNDADRSSFSNSPLLFQRNSPNQWSFSSGFYTDDVEE